LNSAQEDFAYFHIIEMSLEIEVAKQGASSPDITFSHVGAL
jgi:hypothetical protein